MQCNRILICLASQINYLYFSLYGYISATVAETEQWLTSHLVVLKYWTDKNEHSQACFKKWVRDEEQRISVVLDFVGPSRQTFDWTLTTPHMHSGTIADRQTDWTAVQKGRIVCMLWLVKWPHWHSKAKSKYPLWQRAARLWRALLHYIDSAAVSCCCLHDQTDSVAFVWLSTNISLPLVCLPPA